MLLIFRRLLNIGILKALLNQTFSETAFRTIGPSEKQLGFLFGPGGKSSRQEECYLGLGDPLKKKKPDCSGFSDQ